MADTMTDLEPLLDGDTIAVLLGVSRKWVYQAAQDGTIPSYRFGARFIRFRESEIRAWIDSHQRKAST